MQESYNHRIEEELYEHRELGRLRLSAYGRDGRYQVVVNCREATVWAGEFLEGRNPPVVRTGKVTYRGREWEIDERLIERKIREAEGGQYGRS